MNVIYTAHQAKPFREDPDKYPDGRSIRKDIGGFGGPKFYEDRPPVKGWGKAERWGVVVRRIF